LPGGIQATDRLDECFPWLQAARFTAERVALLAEAVAERVGGEFELTRAEGVLVT
jgi:hypothetical protein